jgi:hypothetical protein
MAVPTAAPPRETPPEAVDRPRDVSATGLPPSGSCAGAGATVSGKSREHLPSD